MATDGQTDLEALLVCAAQRGCTPEHCVRGLLQALERMRGYLERRRRRGRHTRTDEDLEQDLLALAAAVLLLDPNRALRTGAVGRPRREPPCSPVQGGLAAHRPRRAKQRPDPEPATEEPRTRR